MWSGGRKRGGGGRIFYFFNGADLNLFHSGTGSGFILGVAVPCGETDPNCFIFILIYCRKILIFCEISCRWYCPLVLANWVNTGFFFRSGSGQRSGIITDPDPKRLSSCLGYCLTFERLSKDGGAVNSRFEDLSAPQRDAESSGCLPRHLQIHRQARRLVDPPERRGVHLPDGDVVPGRRVLHLEYRKKQRLAWNWRIYLS